MKRLLLGFIATLVVLAMMATKVNAASVVANATKIEKGETVTVTVKSDNPIYGMQFVMNYDSKHFEYVSATAGGWYVEANAKNAGEVNVMAFSGSVEGDSVVLTFKATEDTEAVPFTVNDFVGGEETIENPTVNVAVKTETTTTPTQPSENQKPDTPVGTPTESENQESNNAENQSETTLTERKADGKVGTDGKVIKKLPQTGVPVFLGVALALVVTSIVLVVKKIRK